MSVEKDMTCAALRTARGAAAIGSLELWGPSAPAILRRVFRPNTNAFDLSVGKVHYGHFIEGDEVIDDGIVGVEGPGRFALHCHGNPLILERLLRRLEAEGAQILPFEELLLRRCRAESDNLIAAEAKVESLRAVSLAGVRLIQAQASQGLAATVRRWLEAPDLETIRREAREILDRSRVAARLLHPVKILLAGPPNSGKSTLLNRLAGREQALVSDTPGTTRDFVSAWGRIDPLYIEWIDTAGLDEQLRRADSLEQAAQAATLEQLNTADLVLYLLDAAQKPEKLGTVTLFRETGRQKQVTVPGFSAEIPVLTVLNKCDLVDYKRPDALCISAQTGRGIDALAAAILEALEVNTLAPAAPVAFTPRQEQHLETLIEASEAAELKDLLSSLLSSN